MFLIENLSFFRLAKFLHDFYVNLETRNWLIIIFLFSVGANVNMDAVLPCVNFVEGALGSIAVPCIVRCFIHFSNRLCALAFRTLREIFSCLFY